MPSLRPLFPHAAILSALAFLFFLRVAGQLLVAMDAAAFLPPMQEWHSGLLPYSILLPIQATMILVMAKIIRDFVRGEGFFVAPRRRIGRFLEWFSYLYFLSMILRYCVTMWLHPERRWFTGTIPIWFHMILAAFLYTLSNHYLRNRSSPPTDKQSVRRSLTNHPTG